MERIDQMTNYGIIVPGGAWDWLYYRTGPTQFLNPDYIRKAIQSCNKNLLFAKVSPWSTKRRGSTTLLSIQVFNSSWK